MITIGLTGNIGTGKSFTAAIFAELGIPVFNADDAVHALLKKGGAGVKPVAKLFPDVVKEGAVDRKALGAIVFKNPTKRKALETILHPLVRKAEEKAIRAARLKGKHMIVLDIPLLFEAGGWRRVDVIVVVKSSPFIQKRRVLARKGMTLKRFHEVLETQWPSYKKEKGADFVIDTGASKRVIKAQIKKLIAHMKAKYV
ncbi:MAG: dephospho-CoA kinase [Proteobacteria bacterium]|nr:dephospho-CoA kinase [Pseudomonadota bacterium]